MRTVARSSSRSMARRVLSATAEKPPAMRSRSATVSPGLSSKIAGRLTLPINATWGPTGADMDHVVGLQRAVGPAVAA